MQQLERCSRGRPHEHYFIRPAHVCSYNGPCTGTVQLYLRQPGVVRVPRAPRLQSARRVSMVMCALPSCSSAACLQASTRRAWWTDRGSRSSSAPDTHGPRRVPVPLCGSDRAGARLPTYLVAPSRSSGSDSTRLHHSSASATLSTPTPASRRSIDPCEDPRAHAQPCRGSRGESRPSPHRRRTARTPRSWSSRRRENPTRTSSRPPRP